MKTSYTVGLRTCFSLAFKAASCFRVKLFSLKREAPTKVSFSCALAWELEFLCTQGCCEMWHHKLSSCISVIALRLKQIGRWPGWSLMGFGGCHSVVVIRPIPFEPMGFPVLWVLHILSFLQWQADLPEMADAGKKCIPLNSLKGIYCRR